MFCNIFSNCWTESLNLLWGELLWQRKWYLKKTDHFWISKRQKHWHLHITNLFTWRKYISSCSRIKQSYLEKFSSKDLRVWILVNDGTLRNKANFASTIDNANNVKLSDLLAFVVSLYLLSSENHLWWRRTLLESCKFWKHPRGRFFYNNFKK